MYKTIDDVCLRGVGRSKEWRLRDSVFFLRCSRVLTSTLLIAAHIADTLRCAVCCKFIEHTTHGLYLSRSVYKKRSLVYAPIVTPPGGGS